MPKAKLLTPALCRAGRGFLDWTQTDLAERSGVSRSTIRDFEGCHHDIHRATSAQLTQAFEEAGLKILRLDGIGTVIVDSGSDGAPHEKQD
ncbi:transcriptional regulator [Rhizobium sp. TH135]|uniref:helix-turn-helix transcriptional regulator n=1 Tax=Rhizobium sp. TH135 TaxID=2067451 RepID=UPI000C7C3F68|nr:helix-turn-helix domain-containing protein [Rhizobium sp. TH135]PLK69817.1 transcriptional regulator [Rhizobium sp. TH135]